jgi:SPP1 gp7 family putative phage head morphogenesis protein
MLLAAGEAGAAEIGSIFDVTNPRVLDWLGKRTVQFSRFEVEGIGKRIAEELKLGYQLGESIPQITARIQNVFNMAESRATTIARTEMVGSSNQGALEAYKQSGVVRQKQWLAAQDERTRDTHAAAHGQIVDLYDDFQVGADRMQAPGQGSLPEEIINCRCAIAPIQAESRCVKCNKLLGYGLKGGAIQCQRCKTINRFGLDLSAGNTRSETLKTS